MSHALLLQPPPGNLTRPQADFSYLKAHAQMGGYDVQVHDLGIDAFDYLRQPPQIGLLIEKADILRQQLDQLEAATCLGNDKPYAGAINTNHSFLYFKQGPGVFKWTREQM